MKDVQGLVVRLRNQGVSFGEIARQAKKAGFTNRNGRPYTRGSLHGMWHQAKKETPERGEHLDTVPVFELDTCGTTATTSSAEEIVKTILALNVPDSNKVNALSVLFA